jgi:hypothetical protein
MTLGSSGRGCGSEFKEAAEFILTEEFREAVSAGRLGSSGRVVEFKEGGAVQGGSRV